jgi:glycosyltransferase involved in cell wall biosynthesis
MSTISGLPWPSITVVTPSYNQAEFLERTIQSVLRQQYPKLEYIVVDGGSIDGSVEIIRRYDVELKWWCSEPDCGQADAIAKGFLKSSGEILCWLNSDDVMLPGALKTVGRYFQDHPQVNVINGGAYCIDAFDRPLRTAFRCTFTKGVRASSTRFRFYGQDGVYQPATFWRRSAYIMAGGMRKDFSFAMDLDLFTRLASQQRFQVIPAYLACFRIHEKSKSYSMQDVRKQEIRREALRNEIEAGWKVKSRMFYAFYRVSSLLRKAILQMRLYAGLERLPAHFSGISVTINQNAKDR